ncbi:MAG: cytochrome C assembly family protein [Terrimicrobiaceae bacterium]
MVHSLFLWRRGFLRDARVGYFLLVVAFLLQSWAMFLRGSSLQACPINNLFEAMLFVCWGLVVACLTLGISSRLRFIAAFASPLLFAMGVFALMPALDPEPTGAPQFAGWLVSSHAALILLAYGAFGMAAVSAIMFLTQDHNLKLKKLTAVLSVMPPIQRLERVASGLVLAGFVMLTLGLLAGWRLPRPESVSYFADVKVKWSGLLWLAYLSLIIGRWKFDLAGRHFAYAVAGVFAFLLLTFWGTNLLSSLHNP